MDNYTPEFQLLEQQSSTGRFPAIRLIGDDWVTLDSVYEAFDLTLPLPPVEKWLPSASFKKVGEDVQHLTTDDCKKANKAFVKAKLKPFEIGVLTDSPNGGFAFLSDRSGDFDGLLLPRYREAAKTAGIELIIEGNSSFDAVKSKRTFARHLFSSDLRKAIVAGEIKATNTKNGRVTAYDLTDEIIKIKRVNRLDVVDFLRNKGFEIQGEDSCVLPNGDKNESVNHQVLSLSTDEWVSFTNIELAIKNAACPLPDRFIQPDEHHIDGGFTEASDAAYFSRLLDLRGIAWSAHRDNLRLAVSRGEIRVFDAQGRSVTRFEYGVRVEREGFVKYLLGHPDFSVELKNQIKQGVKAAMDRQTLEAPASSVATIEPSIQAVVKNSTPAVNKKSQAEKPITRTEFTRTAKNEPKLMASKGGQKRAEKYMTAKNYIISEWNSFCSKDYDGNKSEFARDYVGFIKNNFGITVKERTIKDAWLKNIPCTSTP